MRLARHPVVTNVAYGHFSELEHEWGGQITRESRVRSWRCKNNLDRDEATRYGTKSAPAGQNEVMQVARRILKVCRNGSAKLLEDSW